MAIVVKLDDMLHARRMTLTELAERIDITLANLSILKTGKARAVRFSTLDAICDVLQCQPGDLLEFAPPPAAEDAPVADSAAATSAGRLPLKRPLGSVPEEA
jgi:putative transcriptional regulator